MKLIGHKSLEFIVNMNAESLSLCVMASWGGNLVRVIASEAQQSHTNKYAVSFSNAD